MSELSVRNYAKDDWPMVATWLRAHGSSRVSEGLLPPVGVVVERDGEPCAAMWCHLSVDIGVAFLDNPVSKQGLGFTEAAWVFSAALGAIEAICKSLDYGLLVANTLPAIARHLERRHDFMRDGDRVQMVKVLNPN